MMATGSVRGVGERQRELTTGGIFKGAAIGAAAGAVVNVLLYFVGGAAGVSLVAEFAKGEAAVGLPLGPVIGASFVPALFAALLALALNRFSAKPSKIFLWVALAFGAFSMMGPVGLGGASVGLKVLLSLMHVVSGITITGGILRFGKAT